MNYNCSSNANFQVCDLYGNTCFEHFIMKPQIIANCTCLPNCETVRFTLNKQEFITDVNEYCGISKTGMNIGTEIAIDTYKSLGVE